MRPLLAVLLLAFASCGTPGEDDATETASLALTAQDVMGFESLTLWTPSSGTESLTSTHTQGVSAYALAAPVNFTNIVSAAIDNSAPNLQGISNAGSTLALDMVIPTQQPNPSFLGSVQLLVSVPSRSVFNLFLAQVELTGLPLGTFQTLRFAVPDSLRTSLRGAAFSDLSFTVALNAPSGATGTYIFDNLRVAAANNADFSVTPSPTNVTVVAGATAQSTVTIARASGFSAGVALSASGLPTGVTAAFNPATTTGTSSVVTFTAASGALTGPATVTITGAGGGLSRTATVSLTVAPAPTFALSASPASVSLVQGATAQSTLSIARQNGFAAAVAFSASGLPAGVTAAFNPASTTGSSSLVTFSASAAAAVGTSTVTVIGTGGGLTRTTTIALTVTAAPTFALSASPAGVSLVEGATAQSTLSIARQNGFAAAVAFSASGLPAGVTAAFNPASTAGPSSVVTFSASATAAVGTSTVTVTGAGGGLTRSTPIALTVTAAPDFALAPNPTSLTIVAGSTAQTSVAIEPVNGFAAAVTFSASGLPAGVTAAFNPPATTGPSTVVTFTASAQATLGPAPIVITGTAGTLIRTAAITLTVAPAPDFALGAAPGNVTVALESTATATVTVTPLDGFVGSVSFSADGLPAGVTATFNPASAADATVVTFAASATASLGTTNVTLSGAGGGLARTTTVALTVASPPGDFALVPGSTGVALSQGETVDLNVAIARIDGFPSTISFAASGLPSGVTATFTPPSTSGDGVTLTLSAPDFATTGPATVTVSGSGGGLVRTATIDLLVNPVPAGDFSLSASPTGVAVTQGESATSNIQIARIDGFAGAVAFSASDLPAGVDAVFAPASTSEDGVTLTLTAATDAATGPATVTVTGTGSGLIRTTTIDLLVNPAAAGDFSLSANPGGFALTQGDSAIGTIFIAPVDGFTGTVAFAAGGLPFGVSAVFTPPASAGAPVQVTFAAAPNATLGPAAVIVTGSAGPLTHSVPISLLVNPAVTGDFDLLASPSGFGANAGDQVSSLITVERFGLTAAVAFQVSGLPDGVTASFTPPSTLDDQTILTLTVAPDAPSSFSTITVTGGAQPGGDPARSVSLTLLVNGS